MNTIIAYILSIYTRVRHIIVLIRDDIRERKHLEEILDEPIMLVRVIDPELEALLSDEDRTFS